MTLRIPEVKTDLPSPDVVVVNHPVAGLFLMIDRRIPDDDPDLQHLRDYILTRAELFPHRIPASNHTPDDDPGGGVHLAPRLRARIATHATQVTTRMRALADGDVTGALRHLRSA